MFILYTGYVINCRLLKHRSSTLNKTRRFYFTPPTPLRSSSTVYL